MLLATALLLLSSSDSNIATPFITTEGGNERFLNENNSYEGQAIRADRFTLQEDREPESPYTDGGRHGFASRKQKKQQVIPGEDFHTINLMVYFADKWFDWMGYHEMPGVVRYSIVLCTIMTPIYAYFFYTCCIVEDFEDEEIDEFMKRYKKYDARRKRRLEMAKQMKWD